MSYQELVTSIIQDSVDAKIQLAEILPTVVSNASEQIVQCLLNDGNILVCGNGNSSLNARHLASTLLNQGERERPALPVIVLDHDPSIITGINQDYGISEIYARQIKALGRSNDLLIIFTLSGNPPNLTNAIQAAHQKEMNVIVFSGGDGGHVSSLLYSDDIEIRVPLQSRYRIYELHLLAAFAICEIVDQQLFGGA